MTHVKSSPLTIEKVLGELKNGGYGGAGIYMPWI